MSINASLLDSVSVSKTRNGFESFIATLVIASKTKNIVVVEGSFDKRILSNFFDIGTTIIKPCDGVGYINKVFARLPPLFTKVIGIVDSDYSFGESKHSRVFCYDYNNIEMMIFHNDQLFDDLNLKLSKSINQKENLIALRDKTLAQLKPLSIFRLVNAKYYASNSVIGKEDVCLDVSTCSSISIDNFKSIVINKINNSVKDGINQSFKTSFISNYNNEYKNNYCPYEITNGHDFVDLFCSYLSIGEDVLRDALESSFTFPLFKQTLLFKRIETYQTIQTAHFLRG